jgi:hypothetical protein
MGRNTKARPEGDRIMVLKLLKGGMTQREVVARTGIPQSTVAHFALREKRDREAVESGENITGPLPSWMR